MKQENGFRPWTLKIWNKVWNDKLFFRYTKINLPRSVGHIFMYPVLSYVNSYHKRKLGDDVDQMQELIWNSTYFF